MFSYSHWLEKTEWKWNIAILCIHSWMQTKSTRCTSVYNRSFSLPLEVLEWAMKSNRFTGVSEISVQSFMSNHLPCTLNNRRATRWKRNTWLFVHRCLFQVVECFSDRFAFNEALLLVLVVQSIIIESSLTSSLEYSMRWDAMQWVPFASCSGSKSECILQCVTVLTVGDEFVSIYT